MSSQVTEMILGRWIPERIFVDAEAGQEGIDYGDADFRGRTMILNRIHRSFVRARFFRHQQQGFRSLPPSGQDLDSVWL